MSEKNGYYKDGYYENDLRIRPPLATLAEAQDDSNKLYFYPLAYNDSPWSILAVKGIYITGISAGQTYTITYIAPGGKIEAGTVFNNIETALDGAGGNANVGTVLQIVLIDLYGSSSVINSFNGGGGSSLPSGEFSVGVLVNGVLQPPINGFQIIEAIDKNFRKYAYYVQSSGYYGTTPLTNGIYQNGLHYWNSVVTPVPQYPTHVWEHLIDGSLNRRWWIGNGNGLADISGRSLVTGSYPQGKFSGGDKIPPLGIVEWFQAVDGDNQWYYYHTNHAGQYKTVRMKAGVYLKNNPPTTEAQHYVAYGLSSPVVAPEVKILKTYDEYGRYKRKGYSSAVNEETPTKAAAGHYKCGTIDANGELVTPAEPLPDIVEAENPSDPAYPKLARWYEVTPQQVKLKNTIIGNEVYYAGVKLQTYLTSPPPYDSLYGPFYMTTVHQKGPPTVKAYSTIGPTPSDCVEANTEDIELLNN